jgi:hypothetical protein
MATEDRPGRELGVMLQRQIRCKGSRLLFERRAQHQDDQLW